MEGVRLVRGVAARHRSRPRRVLSYGCRESNIYTAFAPGYSSLAAIDQRHLVERYSKLRSLYEKAKRGGRLTFFAEDVLDLLAGATPCTPAYYDFVDAEKERGEAADI